MDLHFTSEQLSLPYNGRQHAEQNYLAYRQRAEPFPSNEYDPCDGMDYLPIQQSVPNTPTQFDPQPPFPPNDFSPTQAHDQQRLDIDTAPGWGGPSLQVQGEITNHFGPQGASCSPGPLGSSSAMTVNNLTSQFTGMSSQSGAQGDHPRAPFLREQIEGAAQSYLVAQEHRATTQGPSRRRVSEQKIQEKRRKDKERKSKYRVDGKQAYARICELLEIDLMPENTRAQRILEVVEELVEQVDAVDSLRRRVEEAEEYVHILNESFTNSRTGVNIGSSLPPHQGPSYAG